MKIRLSLQAIEEDFNPDRKKTAFGNGVLSKKMSEKIAKSVFIYFFI